MKRNKALYILSLLFYTIVPLVIFFIQYSPNPERTSLFKISVGSIIALIFVVLAIKNLVFRHLFDEIRSEMTNLKAQYIATPTDSVRKAWTKRKLVLRIFDCVPIILAGVCIILIAKALENQLIVLSGALTFILISIALGVIFDCWSISMAK